MEWLKLTMVAVGMMMLAASIKPISAIVSIVGSGRLHRLWCILRIFVILFMIGYAAFYVMRISEPTTSADLVVSTILLGGGGFVLIVTHLSALTTTDIVRIASLERDVVRDPLTGAFNRRYLQGKLEEEVARSHRSRRPLSALLIDLDHFKQINDDYGHPVGDVVLKHVSDLIVGCSHMADTVVRYGGEEFLILAPDSDLVATRIFGEDLLRTIASRSIALPDGASLMVTASIGVACLTVGQVDDDFISRADEALYAAKRCGRNRVCAFHDNDIKRAA